MTEKVSFDTVEPGTQLPSIERPVTQEAMWKYAVASLDYNTVHVHPEWCKTAQVFGLESTVGHGQMTMSFLGSVLSDWAYPVGGWIKKMDCKFIKPVLPGDKITCGGVVTEKHPIGQGKDFVVVSIYAANQKGEMVAVGEAEVTLP